MKTVLSQKLDAFFASLRAIGYFARQTWQCCQGCGFAAIPDDKSTKIVFYHRQDKTGLDRYKGTYVSWSGNGDEICKLAKEAGLLVYWEGREHQRIWVGERLPQEVEEKIEHEEKLAAAKRALENFSRTNTNVVEQQHDFAIFPIPTGRFIVSSPGFILVDMIGGPDGLSFEAGTVQALTYAAKQWLAAADFPRRVLT